MKQRQEKAVLFLCTGNYYRSRFAEVLFNSVAGKMGLPWRASSRGLALERGVHNVGPMAAAAVQALEARGLRAVADLARFREFIAFEPLGRHPTSGMPLTKEFRLFFLDGQPLFWTPYWDEGDYAGLVPPVERFAAVAGGVRSRFVTMDVAQRRGGDWLIVELGDAQVAGLPEHADVGGFYKALRDHWPTVAEDGVGAGRRQGGERHHRSRSLPGREDHPWATSYW
jgi:hypothetical protein